ncbi:MAG: VOC family protein [Polyangiaceae bacterium]|jgi:predicted enzyme related to lactoylglutathione lyase
MTNVINWFEIPAKDLDRAARFYEAVLGTTLRRERSPGTEMAVFPHGERHEPGGALVKRGAKPSASGTLVYLDARGDLDAAIARVEKAGGRVAVPRTDLGKDGAFAVVVDTEGNAVGLHVHAS